MADDTISKAEERDNFFDCILNGQKAQQTPWKRVVERVGFSIPEAVGQLYVARFFPASARAKAIALVQNVKETFAEGLDALDWMSTETKRAAHAKLDASVAKIGYPDKWIDYSSVRIHKASYVWNVFRSKKFDVRRRLKEIGRPLDRMQWGMPPQLPNAYYGTLLNEIAFPAAILQPPFFDPDADDAYNYGGIGMVVGHEMTHGFDDKGSLFDARGNLLDWWTAADRTEFERRMDLIRDQYGKFEVADGVKLIGKLVAGEAAADLGGAKLAYLALQKVLKVTGRKTDDNGFTDEQRFFIAIAQIWAAKAQPEYEKLNAVTDPHPPGRYRVSGTLAHMPEFTRAFALPDNCAMMLPPEKRAQLW